MARKVENKSTEGLMKPSDDHVQLEKHYEQLFLEHQALLNVLNRYDSDREMQSDIIRILEKRIKDLDSRLTKMDQEGAQRSRRQNGKVCVKRNSV